MPARIRTNAAQRERRHARLRARVHGAAGRPRLSVFRSNRHLQVQLIDDAAGRTLVALADRHLGATVKGGEASAGIARAQALGRLLAERARGQGIAAVVFDRGGYAYHGQVKAVAEGAREGGLKF